MMIEKIKFLAKLTIAFYHFIIEFPVLKYGILYFSTIPIFAVIYWVIPDCLNGASGFIDCLYFSVTTITTLGYGDFHPLTTPGKMVVIVQALTGVLLLGLFFNAISHEIASEAKEREKRDEEREYLKYQTAKINGFMAFIEPLMEDYKSTTIQITTPMSENNRIFNPDFTIRDMQDLHKGSLLVRHNFSVPAIEMYYKVLHQLTKELIDMVKTVDLRQFPKLQQLVLSFIKASHDYDASEAIIKNKGLTSSNEPFIAAVEKMLSAHSIEFEFANGTILTPYYLLFMQLKIQMKLIEPIESELQKIIKT